MGLGTGGGWEGTLLWPAYTLEGGGGSRVIRLD